MEGVKLKNFGSRRKTLRISGAIRVLMTASDATTDATIYLKLVIELRSGYIGCREV